MVRSMRRIIVYNIGSFVLKHDDPRKAKFFFDCWVFYFDFSYKNSRLILPFSNVRTLDWNIRKSKVSELEAIELRVSLTQTEFLSLLYSIWKLKLEFFYFPLPYDCIEDSIYVAGTWFCVHLRKQLSSRSEKSSEWLSYTLKMNLAL